jgi:hypothetical protein
LLPKQYCSVKENIIVGEDKAEGSPDEKNVTIRDES